MVTKTVTYFVFATCTEGDDELLALANLLCCKEETDDILDVIYGLHDDMQHFIDSQAVEAEESQVDR